MFDRSFSARLPLASLIAAVLLTSGCMRYLTHDRAEVLIEGVDIDQTLKVAEIELAQHDLGSSLTVWAIRDQVVRIDQAQRISRLYFDHVSGLERRFDVWHLTWAVSNLYRQGSEEVRDALQAARDDAVRRARKLGGIADRMVNGDSLYLGDAHSGGRAYARKHLVVPGNPRYLQSFEEFQSQNRR